MSELHLWGREVGKRQPAMYHRCDQVADRSADAGLACPGHWMDKAEFWGVGLLAALTAVMALTL